MVCRGRGLHRVTNGRRPPPRPPPSLATLNSPPDRPEYETHLSRTCGHRRGGISKSRSQRRAAVRLQWWLQFGGVSGGTPAYGTAGQGVGGHPRTPVPRTANAVWANRPSRVRIPEPPPPTAADWLKHAGRRRPTREPLRRQGGSRHRWISTTRCCRMSVTTDCARCRIGSAATTGTHSSLRTGGI